MATTTVNDDGGDDPIREDGQPEVVANEQEQHLQDTLNALETDIPAPDEPEIPEFVEPADSPVADVQGLDNLDQTISGLPEEFPFETPDEPAKSEAPATAKPTRQRRAVTPPDEPPDTLYDFLAGGGEMPPDVGGEDKGENPPEKAFLDANERFASRMTSMWLDAARRLDELTARIEAERL